LVYFIVLVFVLQVTKKLAGAIGDSAAWMSNIGNEFGQVLNSVLTTGEGAGLEELCQGVIERIKNCPLTPIFGQAVRKFDIFGKKIPCKCGYHDVSIVIESLNI
jgi:hypothetical protein